MNGRDLDGRAQLRGLAGTLSVSRVMNHAQFAAEKTLLPSPA